MLLQQHSYPFKSLSIPDAQQIWKLAEEDHERRSTTADAAEESPLLSAVRSLNPTAYRELITLACMGHGHDKSFDCKRAHAEAEISRDNIGLQCPRLHCYLRSALSSFGVPPLHKPNQDNYATEVQPPIGAELMAAS
jgi:hypothetical protein